MRPRRPQVTFSWSDGVMGSAWGAPTRAHRTAPVPARVEAVLINRADGPALGGGFRVPWPPEFHI